MAADRCRSISVADGSPWVALDRFGLRLEDFIERSDSPLSRVPLLYMCFNTPLFFRFSATKSTQGEYIAEARRRPRDRAGGGGGEKGAGAEGALPRGQTGERYLRLEDGGLRPLQLEQGLCLVNAKKAYIYTFLA